MAKTPCLLFAEPPVGLEVIGVAYGAVAVFGAGVPLATGGAVLEVVFEVVGAGVGPAAAGEPVGF